MLQSLLKISLHKPGKETILYEPTLKVYSCIRWAESKFTKLSWTQNSLCTFHFQRVGRDRAKWEEPALCSSNLKKKAFQEKKKTHKIFTASHKLQMSSGGHKDDLMLGLHCCRCLDPSSSSQSPLPAGRRNLGKRQLGPVKASCQQEELNLPCHSPDLHQAWNWKVLETSWGSCTPFIFISFQMQLKEKAPQTQTKSTSLVTKVRERHAKCNSAKISVKEPQFWSWPMVPEI